MVENALKNFLAIRLVEHAISRVVVGFSAGLDSTALLHALVAVREAQAWPVEILALHVHHGLSPDADAWARQVQATARRLGVPCEVQHVRVGEGASLEAEARQARYTAFRERLGPGDALLLAQHRDDQAETLLFRLARGAGVRGLGAMHAESELMPGVPLWRPLLAVSRLQLETYVRAQGLGWVDDESNADTRHARNFLRHRVIPELNQHWPELGRTLAATARRMQEADALLGEYARQLLDAIRLNVETVSVGGLLALTPAQRRLVLRECLLERELPLPEEHILEQIERDVLTAAADATPLVAWAGGECRRYRDGLYLLSPLLPVPGDWETMWSGEPVALPDGRGLRAGPGSWPAGRVQLRYRRGGERFRAQGQAHSRELKTLLQEAGIPPWQRERLPLLFLDGELALVPGQGQSAAWAATGVVVELLPAAG